jgi:hypothetical protein
MDYRKPQESQVFFETRTLQTQCPWQVIAYDGKLKGFSTVFSAAGGTCSDVQTVPPLRADIALRNVYPLVTGKNDLELSDFCP